MTSWHVPVPLLLLMRHHLYACLLPFAQPSRNLQISGKTATCSLLSFPISQENSHVLRRTGCCSSLLQDLALHLHVSEVEILSLDVSCFLKTFQEVLRWLQIFHLKLSHDFQLSMLPACVWPCGHFAQDVSNNPQYSEVIVHGVLCFATDSDINFGRPENNPR